MIFDTYQESKKMVRITISITEKFVIFQLWNAVLKKRDLPNVITYIELVIN